MSSKKIKKTSSDDSIPRQNTGNRKGTAPNKLNALNNETNSNASGNNKSKNPQNKIDFIVTHEEKPKRNWWKIGFNILQVIGIVSAIGFAWRADGTATRAIIAAESANQIAKTATNQSKEQFLAKNTPILQVTGKIRTFKPGALITIDYDVQNMSDFPATVVGSQVLAVAAYPIPPYSKIRDENLQDVDQGIKLVQNGPTHFTYSSVMVLPKFLYDEVMTKDCTTHFMGYIRYKTEIDPTIRKFYFRIGFQNKNSDMVLEGAKTVEDSVTLLSE